MKVTAVAEGLHAVAVGPVNVFLLDTPDGLALIDAGLPDRADGILRAMHGLGRDPRDLRHIVLTHAHPDHIGSLAALVEATGAETWMHPLDAPIAERGHGFRPMTAAPGLLRSLMFRAFVRPDASVQPARIDHLIHDGDVLPVAGGLSVVHVPGHCAGQVALLWRNNVLFAGDACSNVPRLGEPLGYENRDDGQRSQRRLAGLDFRIACFGHGKAILHDAAACFRRRWG